MLGRITPWHGWAQRDFSLALIRERQLRGWELVLRDEVTSDVYEAIVEISSYAFHASV